MPLASSPRFLPSTGAFRLAPAGFLFGVDLRTLAFFRVFLGCILIADLVSRGRYMRSFYTDFGILPRSAYYELAAESYRVSFHVLGGSLTFQAFLFAIAGMLAAALVCGVFTRTVTVLSWLFLVSLESRNAYATGGADTLLRVTLFWAMFLPLGARFSLDAKIWPDRVPKSNIYCAISSAAILLQPAILYLFTALLKSGLDWQADGSAVYFALHLDSLASELGRYLRDYPTIMQVMTRYVLAIEFAALLLLFLPVLQPAVRIIALVGLFAMHMGFFLFMRLELFPFISWLALAPIIPGLLWESALWPRLARALPRGLLRPYAAIGDLADRVAIWARASMPYRVQGRAARSEESASSLARLRMVLREGACLVALVIVILWNVAGVPAVSFALPEPVRALALTLGINQRWTMFAPRPSHAEYWYVIRGQLENGESVDVYRMTKGEPKWEKPADPFSVFESRRWRKFLERLPEDKYGRLRLFYARYLCRKWNEQAARGEKLSTLEIGIYRELKQANYQPAKFSKRILRKHDCGLKKK